MDSIISTFHIDWKIIIAQVVNFGIVFAVLYIYALKPLSKLMSERSEKIQKGMDDAKTNAVLLAKAKSDYEETIVKAKAEAQKMWDESKKEIEMKKAQMMDEAHKEVATMMENGKKMLQGEKEKMVSEAKSEVINLAVMAAEKLIGTKMDSSFSKKSVDELNNL